MLQDETIFGYEAVWLDLSRFEHWIEDSIVVRWAALTAEMNRDDPQSLSRTLPLLLSRPAAERATGEMCGWLSTLPQPVECVWSGRSLSQAFDVDHAIPYTVWGNNDLWNLLPCDPKLNRGKNGKFAKLPTHALLQARRERIISYWQQR